jgi:hypothetical protein
VKEVKEVKEVIEVIETIVETDTVTATADDLVHRTTEAIDEVKAMSMPTLPAETTVIVSVKTDTRAAKDEVAIVSGIVIEDHPVETPGATTTIGQTGETEIPTKTVVAVEETDVRTDFRHIRSAVARARHLRSESQLQI